MPIKRFDSEASITTFWADFLERLKRVEWSSFVKGTLKKPFRLLFSRWQSETLKKKMGKRLEYDELLEKSPRVFVKVLI